MQRCLVEQQPKYYFLTIYFATITDDALLLVASSNNIFAGGIKIQLVYDVDILPLWDGPVGRDGMLLQQI